MLFGDFLINALHCLMIDMYSRSTMTLCHFVSVANKREN